ncbi:ChaN family lipoprotein [soil metagenome]
MGAALLTLACLFAQAAAPPPVQPSSSNPHAAVQAAYVPVRVYDTARRAFIDFEVMLADVAKIDVALVGEQHAHPNTHRLEAAMLQGLLRRGASVIVSIEMFERDVQPVLDAYLAGEGSEDEFLATSRPWPRYVSDYRPLVEMARAHQWPVLASNVPRRLAQEVAKSGRAALDELPEADGPLVARDLQCPQDTYYERFVDSMSSHPVAGEDTEAAHQRTARYYWSQCLKDETMAESIAAAIASRDGPPGPVVHYNGAFHSDFGLGVAERVRRRLPNRRVAVISILPVGDIDAVAPADGDLKRADYLVYTVK